MEQFSLANRSTQDQTCLNHTLCTIKIDVKQPIKHNGTYRQVVEVDRINAAVLTEELAEIYSTPTPKGCPEPKKSK